MRKTFNRPFIAPRELLTLVAVLDGLMSSVRVRLDGEDVVIVGSTGEHRLDAMTSSLERVVQHYLGYAEGKAFSAHIGPHALSALRRAGFNAHLAHMGRLKSITLSRLT